MFAYSKELIEAVREVFQTMIFMSIESGDEFVPTHWPPDKQYTAMIGLGGEESGLIYIHCDELFAVKSTNAMLGMDIGDDKDSIVDAMGEIANMVGGSFKHKVTLFEDYKLSLPSVIVGKDYTTHVPHGHETKVFGFKSDGDRFMVQLVLKR